MAIDKSKALDPVNLQQTSKYIKDGLTVVSNNTDIVPRDENGNIIVQDGSYMVIETNSFNINNNTMLKVLDTQFNYFKFPVQIEEELVDANLDIDLDFEQELQDPIYARYRPTDNNRILAASTFAGIEMNFVEDGQPQKSPNLYYISKEIKNAGVDLRFRIKIQHRFDSTVNQGFGTTYFSIIKNGVNTNLNREFLGPFANNTAFNPPSNTDGFGYIRQYEVQTLNLDLVIENSQFDIGDYFGIGAFAGQENNNEYHTINNVQSYWVITDASKNVDTWNQPIG